MPVNSTNMFSSLEPVGSVGYRRGMSFVCGVTAQALVIVVAILIGLLFPHDLQFSSKHTELIWLPNITPPAPLPAVKIPRELPRMALPKVSPPPPPPAKIAIATPEYAPPKIQHVEPLRVHELPAPTAAAPAPAPKVKEQIVVRTGVFGGAAEPVTVKRPVEQVQTGGFGSPEGVPSHAQKEATANTPVLGAFGLPSGPGAGNGTNGNRGVQGVVVSVGFSSGIASVANGRGNGTGKVVASAGFGSGTPGVGNGHGPSGTVSMGGFSKAQPAAPSPVKVAQASGPADFQPIEILFETGSHLYRRGPAVRHPRGCGGVCGIHGEWVHQNQWCGKVAGTRARPRSRAGCLADSFQASVAFGSAAGFSGHRSH